MSWWRKLLKKAIGEAEPASPEGASGETGCSHGEIHLREGTAQFEWFIAQAELEQGNLEHGASHLANLLSFDPANPEWLELLERYLAAAGPDPESLIPESAAGYYASEALRAYIWHKQGRLVDAADLLASIAQAKPVSRYAEAWLLGWLEPAGAVESLSEESGLFLFAQVLNRFTEARFSTAPRLREIRRWARLCQRFADQRPGASLGLMIRAGLFRKAGWFEEAEMALRPALDAAPDWHLATALGLILREKGDVHGAEQAFELALRCDPADVSARLEAGDTFFNREEWAQALKWYESALSVERRNEWALPSALFCRWMLTENQAHLRELAQLAERGNSRAQQLHNQLYASTLPEPVDASANLLRQLRETLISNPSRDPGGKVSVTLSGLEAPSNYLAFRMEMAAIGEDLGLEVTVTNVAHPDPRTPIAPIIYCLWKYEGTDASPALPPPAPDVVERIRQVATIRDYELEGWAAASRVAEELGPERAAEVLAVMTNPPPVPEGLTALAWLPRVQLAAAQIAAQLDDGWEGSMRREALLSVLHGPQDWATEAAIRALAKLGREHETLAPDIDEAFKLLADHRPHPGFCSWERALYECWLELPHLFPHERKQMEEKLRLIQQEAQAE